MGAPRASGFCVGLAGRWSGRPGDVAAGTRLLICRHGGSIPGVTPARPVPSVRHLLPISSGENRWSDLFADLIDTDPVPIRRLLHLRAGRHIRVEREVPIPPRDRLDLMIRADGHPLAVIETKLLSGLGPRQLERYASAIPDADHYFVLHPRRLGGLVTSSSGWSSLTWEAVLAAHALSDHPWVAETARAWSAHLDAALPHVATDTRWNDIRNGDAFGLGLRTRMAWVFANLQLPAGIEADLVSSSAGNSSVLRLYAPDAKPGYRALVEAEEALPVRDYPKLAGPDGSQLKGPRVRAVLLQDHVDTSAGFDWRYLASMWPHMAAHSTSWDKKAPRPKAPVDRANYDAMVASGGPANLGFGFGDNQAQRAQECMFGAQLQLPANISLGQFRETVDDLAGLVLSMARQRPDPS